MKSKQVISIRFETNILDWIVARANEKHKKPSEIVEELVNASVGNPQESGNAFSKAPNLPPSTSLEAQTQFPFDRESVKMYYRQKAVELAKTEGAKERREIVARDRAIKLSQEKEVAEAKSYKKWRQHDNDMYRTKIARFS